MVTPPPDLANAIAIAATRFAVPPDILTGVWIKESGGNFPNPYVNASGYGGLFGTKLWNGSTQAQADLAAGTLAYWYAQTGLWSMALYHYSGGGYTSVPGQTTEDEMAGFDEWVDVPKDANGHYETTWGTLENERGQQLASTLAAAQAAESKADAALKAISDVKAEVDRLVFALISAPSSPVGEDQLPTPPPAPTP